MVCATDGVAVAENRLGRWVHTDELPRETDPDHEIVALEEAEWRSSVVKRDDLRQLVVALLMHHREHHADPNCPWVHQVEAALRSPVA